MGLGFSWKSFGALFATNIIVLLPPPGSAVDSGHLLLNGVFMAFIIGVGLAMANRVGLGLATESGLLGLGKSLMLAVLIGVVLAVVTFVARAWIAVSFFENLEFLGFLEASRQSYSSWGAAIWRELAGAVAQETAGRLFVMSLTVALLTILFPVQNSSGLFYPVGIIVAAVYNRSFDLVSTFSQALGSGELLTLASIMVNIAPALVFGWLFWKRGWEAALVCHLTMALSRVFLIMVLTDLYLQL